ncbi:hypothetical protein F2Q70_00038879 [Brassica cretica]|uniref:Uncharacterized protein n=1 Tax=Brassica cretica TaxID=69181 RepID=A0A8S9KBP4_BRACR|nr:hypothetical protein F2Q70_00038879 [Brassica cretica]
MFHQLREKMKQRVVLKKKSDPEKFVVPCIIGGQSYANALCDTALRRKHETSDKSSKKVATQRPNACSARSLRSDRARAKLGRYVETKLDPSPLAT